MSRRRVVSIKGATYERIQRYCSEQTRNKGYRVSVAATVERLVNRYLDVHERLEKNAKG